MKTAHTEKKIFKRCLNSIWNNDSEGAEGGLVPTIDQNRAVSIIKMFILKISKRNVFFFLMFFFQVTKQLLNSS